jgi:hypothetical protein
MAAIHTALLIVALVCFVLAGVNVASPRVNLVAIGLAAWIASVLL